MEIKNLKLKLKFIKSHNSKNIETLNKFKCTNVQNVQMHTIFISII